MKPDIVAAVRRHADSIEWNTMRTDILALCDAYEEAVKWRDKWEEMAALQVADVNQARADADALAVALKVFYERFAEAQGAINSAITMSSIHGAPYTGPDLVPEIAKVIDALAAHEARRRP